MLLTILKKYLHNYIFIPQMFVPAAVCFRDEQ
jgi:hypothetical protein